MKPERPNAPRARPIFFFTLDVEPDYGRTEHVALLERAGEFLAWARDEGLPVTAFVVGRFFEDQPRAVETLASGGAALALHGYRHALSGFGTMETPHTEEIERGFEAYRRRLGRAPSGYRAPLGILSRADLVTLGRLGFRYDASLFPLRRPGRYDFRRVPRSPFRWRDADLLEFPFGVLLDRLPAGMTFTNLAGAGLGRRLIARAKNDRFVFDSHLHNLFHNPAALRELPFGFRAAYGLGRLTGGWAGLRRLVAGLRREGWSFESLEDHALRASADALPSFAWSDIAPTGGAGGKTI